MDANSKAVIAPIKARELVNLDGIADQSLFAFNVRGPLGKTQVNKDIVTSIKDRGRHKLFPLFHNGITIIAKEVNQTADAITARDYNVVNGCQSLTALFENQKDLSDDLRVLVKFIKMDPGSNVAADITKFSNNQNGVRPRDFKANSPIQVRLQREVTQHYGGTFFYSIKEGEPLGGGAVISNETAGLWLRAFDLKEPWATHRKYEVFDEKHSDIFGHPRVDADRIVFLYVMANAIDAALPQIKKRLVAKYAITKFVLLYILRGVLDGDGMGQEISENWSQFVRDANRRDKFGKCIQRVLGDIVVDFNAEVENLGENFDYRGKLRDSEWVKKVSSSVVGDHQKLVARGRITSVKDDWHGD